jgi:hypothetical protein
VKKKSNKNGKSPSRQPKKPRGINGFKKPTPALLAWAKKQYSKEEILAGLKEMKKTGGLELKDFLHELEEAAKPR